MALTPEQDAVYALDNRQDRNSLPMDAQREYDRILAERVAAEVAAGQPSGGAAPRPSASTRPGSRPAATAEDYARQTRNATVFIAWVVGIFAVVSLIAGIVIGVSLIHAVNNSNGGGGVSNCISQGGTNPNC